MKIIKAYWPSWALVALAVASGPMAAAQECASDGVCDKHERCTAWKNEGQCLRDIGYMNTHCPVACRDVERKVPTDCSDAHENCAVWAGDSECPDNLDLRKFCPKSCGECPTHDQGFVCRDMQDECAYWAEAGECKNNPRYMEMQCSKSCDTCHLQEAEYWKMHNRKVEEQVKKYTMDEKTLLEKSETFGDRQTATGNQKDATIKVVKETLQYMDSDEFANLPRATRENCKNRNELCAFWAVIGECEKNKAFMQTKCAPSCKTCDLLDISNRCPKLPDAVPALKPGDLNKMFERIVATAPGNRTLTDDEKAQLLADGMTEYTVAVHSRPSDSPVSTIDVGNDKRLPPWIITFDNFITEEECEAMIEAGHRYEYKRSEDVGKENFDGSHASVQSTRRTSENAWCSTRSGCRAEDVPTRLHERMSKVMNIPAENSEDLQLLKYEKGQFYRAHHDYIPHQRDRQCGPRILTFFMYLSDVEEGGGTNFPNLGITVMPKRGRAVLWPSVLNAEPLNIDDRTRHQALDVETGTKFAANGWIHQFDYVGPQDRGCN